MGRDEGTRRGGNFLKKFPPRPPENFPGSFASIPVLGTTYTFLSTLAFVGKFFSHLLKRNDMRG